MLGTGIECGKIIPGLVIKFRDLQHCYVTGIWYRYRIQFVNPRQQLAGMGGGAQEALILSAYCIGRWCFPPPPPPPPLNAPPAPSQKKGNLKVNQINNLRYATDPLMFGIIFLSCCPVHGRNTEEDPRGLGEHSYGDGHQVSQVGSTFCLNI